MGDMWSRKVFVALLRRYGIRPYRYKRQRYTTVMAKVSKKFVDRTRCLPGDTSGQFRSGGHRGAVPASTEHGPTSDRRRP